MYSHLFLNFGFYHAGPLIAKLKMCEKAAENVRKLVAWEAARYGPPKAAHPKTGTKAERKAKRKALGRAVLIGFGADSDELDEVGSGTSSDD